MLDGSGYATLMRWRLYAEEGLAGEEAELWLLENALTVEHAGEPLVAYEVAYDAAGGRSGAGRLLEVGKPVLFETSHALGQMRLFGLAETLGEDGWLKALRLDDYAPEEFAPPPTCCSRSSSPTRTPSKEPDAATSAAMPATAMRRRVYESVWCVEGKFCEIRGLSPHSVFASMPGREAGPRLLEGEIKPRAELCERSLICGIRPGSPR